MATKWQLLLLLQSPYISLLQMQTVEESGASSGIDSASSVAGDDDVKTEVGFLEMMLLLPLQPPFAGRQCESTRRVTSTGHSQLSN